MKKRIAVLFGMLLLFGASSTVASAGAHHGYKSSGSYNCNISGCSNRKAHSHAVCSVSGCTNTSAHKRNNVYYLGHHSRDGHAHSGYHRFRHH